jgi:phosphotriesterase-related protein
VKEVMTVLGPVPADQLGITSMHEHVMMDGRRAWWVESDSSPDSGDGVSGDDPIILENVGLIRRKWKLAKDNMVFDDEDLMAAEVADFKAAGGATLVEVSSIGLRHDLLAIRRISQKTGVNIVASTGFYQDNAWPEDVQGKSVQELASLMVKEIEVGIGDTGIRAGHIGELGIRDLGEKDVMAVEAAARAAMETGLSVTAHQATGKPHGGRVADILTLEGLVPDRIIICHVDEFLFERRIPVLACCPERWGLNLEFVRGLLDRGVNVSFDLFGHVFDVVVGGIPLAMVTDWQRVVAIKQLVDAGYAAQIVLATDTFIKTLLRRYGGEGYAHLPGHILPSLRSLGVSDYDIRQMTVANPARLLAR